MLQVPISEPEKRLVKVKKPRKPGRHKLRNHLVKMITEGTFKPGAKLSQSALAKKFKVSLSLIREALLDLQMYGLVEANDNRGIFVRRFDEKTLLDIIDVREALEGMAVRLCCGKIQPDEISELSAMIDQMCAFAAKGQHEKRAEVDRQFHDRLYEISENQSIRALTRQCYLFGKLVWTDADPDHLRRAHSKTLKAVTENKPDEAERAARDSICNLRNHIKDRIENHNGEGIYWLG